MSKDEGLPVDLFNSVDVDRRHTGFSIIKDGVSGSVQGLWRFFNKCPLVHNVEVTRGIRHATVPFPTVLLGTVSAVFQKKAINTTQNTVEVNIAVGGWR